MAHTVRVCAAQYVRDEYRIRRSCLVRYDLRDLSLAADPQVRGECHRCNYGSAVQARARTRVVMPGVRLPPGRRHKGVRAMTVILPVVRQQWLDRAACLQADPDAFYPEKGGSSRAAKRVCHTCPVQTDCLSYALANDERFGIWGGMSERERRQLKRRAS